MIVFGWFTITQPNSDKDGVSRTPPCLATVRLSQIINFFFSSLQSYVYSVPDGTLNTMPDVLSSKRHPNTPKTMYQKSYIRILIISRESHSLTLSDLVRPSSASKNNFLVITN